jgi:hypothetical protein
MVWELMGLSLSLAGTILIAFSIVPGTLPVYDEKKDMLEHIIPRFKKYKFRFGIAFVAIGFVLQIVGLILINLQKANH